MTRCFRARPSSSPCYTNSRTMSKRRLTGASGSKSSVRVANRHSLALLISVSFSSMERTTFSSTRSICNQKETHRVMKSERSSCRPTKWKVKCLISKISNSLRFKMAALMSRSSNTKTLKSRCRKSESRTLKASCSLRRVKTTKKARFIYRSYKTLAKNLTQSKKTFWA